MDNPKNEYSFTSNKSNKLINPNLRFQQRIDYCLQRIANFLLLNASFIDNLGLLNGKMGIAIFFYLYSRYTKNKVFEDFAGELLDEIYEAINTNTPINFDDGLTGIGWGIEYLIRNKFIEGNTDEVLKELDNIVYKHLSNNPVLINPGNDIFGYGFYYIARLKGHEIDDESLNNLIKKYHLVFLVDECERLLIHKRYREFNILNLNPVTINAFLLFLYEMYKLALFPIRVNKLLLYLPEYLTFYNKEKLTPADSYILNFLSSEIHSTVVEQEIKILYKSVSLENNVDIESIKHDINLYDFLVTTCINKLIFNQHIGFNENEDLLFQKVFGLIDNDDSFYKMINQVNKLNLGLKGFTGAGLLILNSILQTAI